MCLSVSGLAISPAQAAPPGAELIEFEDSFEFVDEGFQAECGVATVVVTGEVTVKGWAFGDGTARVRERLNVVFTNAESGTFVKLDGVRNFDDAPEVVTSADGFTTVVLESVVTGAPEKWSAPGVGVIVMDRGNATIRTTLVFDDSIVDDDPLVSFSDEVITQGGSHTIAQNGFMLTGEQLSTVCGILAG